MKVNEYLILVVYSFPSVLNHHFILNLLSQGLDYLTFVLEGGSPEKRKVQQLATGCKSNSWSQEIEFTNQLFWNLPFSMELRVDRAHLLSSSFKS